MSETNKQLLDDLNYLNMGEIKFICKKWNIPFSISIETPHGVRKSGENDRKGIILQRIRHYLKTGMVLPATCFPARVVSFEPLPKECKPGDRLFYGQWEKRNAPQERLLKDLTQGEFRTGAIARILARDFWSRGVAPTYREFASAWLQAKRDHNKPNPEWAFLSDLHEGKNTADWKRLRNEKARKVLKALFE